MSLTIQTSLRYIGYALFSIALANISLAQITPLSGSPASPDETYKYSVQIETTDQAGAVIVRAHVKLLGTDGQLLQKSVTNERGIVQFSNLPRGSYAVQASTFGFKMMKTNFDLPRLTENTIRLTLDVAPTVDYVVLQLDPDPALIKDAKIKTESWILELPPAFSFPLPTPLPPPRPARSPMAHFFSGLGHKLGF